MKAIALIPHTTTIRLVDRPEPDITAPDEIQLRIIRVGVCGTDREEAAGGRALAPEGKQDLVIGHEMFGQVVKTGQAVTRVQPGDYAIFTVRRGCCKCLPCAMNRSDMCRTGDYRERGIWGLDGYQTECVVDKEQYIVRVPQELVPVAVLTEPLSIVEKAIDESVRLQFTRLPGALETPQWAIGRRCLIAGLGPVGLLAALALCLRGAQVFGMDIFDADTARPQWLTGIGGTYIDGREIQADQVDDVLGPMDLIFEATGAPELQFNLLNALALNGVYVLTGIPSDDCSLRIPGAELIRGLVLNNQIMLGSVNAARGHFEMAVSDLLEAQLRWGDHVKRLITHRYPYSDFAAAICHHPPDEIKTVVEWATC
jgi:glucose 1-dehydrogenase